MRGASRYANYTMMKIANATGHVVVWNRKSLLQEAEARTMPAVGEDSGRHETPKKDPKVANSMGIILKGPKTSGIWKIADLSHRESKVNGNSF